MFRRQYFEAVDLVVNCIGAHFDQPGYQIYKNVESLLINAANGESFDEEFQKVADFYKDDFNSGLLCTQLESLNASFKENKYISRVDMKAILKYFRSTLPHTLEDFVLVDIAEHRYLIWLFGTCTIKRLEIFQEQIMLWKVGIEDSKQM